MAEKKDNTKKSSPAEAEDADGPEALHADPRTRWLVEQVPRWTAAKEKCLVFVHELDVLEELVRILESETQTRVTLSNASGWRSESSS